MRTTWLALGSLLAAACATGDGGPPGSDASQDDVAVDVARADASSMDAARIDVAARDTATTDSVSQRDTASMPDTTSHPDVAPLMCPATCATNDTCTAGCPAATTGAWCCLASTCVDRASCGTVTPDAGSSCTGTFQCDASHGCAIPGTRCCMPLPGLGGCGFCSPGSCPG